MTDPHAARWLVADEGLAVLGACVDMLDQGRSPLEVASKLRREGLDADRSSLALDAATARRRAARDRLGTHDLVFTRSSLEQASHPAVAAWRAHRSASAARRWDLCAGVGGDALALACHGPVVAVERDPVLVVLLAHNARLRDADIDARLADAVEVRPPASAHVHVDPARRDGQRRLRILRETIPPVDRLLAVHGAVGALGIVLPPAVDVQDPLLADGEVEFVQHGRRLIEATLWRGSARRTNLVASAAILPTDGDGDPDEVATRGRSGPVEPLASGPLGAHLVEVAAAAVRARLHDVIGQEIGARRIDPRRALLSCDQPPPPSVWYAVRPIEAVLAGRAKVVRSWLRTRDDLPIEIRLHGVAVDPEAWWRQVGAPARGPRGRLLELVRTTRGVIVLVTRDEAGSAHPDAGSPRTSGQGR
jgi:hypothetical protein